MLDNTLEEAAEMVFGKKLPDLFRKIIENVAEHKISVV